MSRQRIGEQRAIQYMSESVSFHCAGSMLSTQTPAVAASALNAVSVHQVKWCGGALRRKFGMRVSAEGTCGTLTTTSPPGRVARTMSANISVGEARCSTKAQTISYAP